MLTLVRVNSDNFHNQLFTVGAYRELRLQMSTGDFHSHIYEYVKIEDGDEEVDWDQVIDEKHLERSSY